MRTPMEVHHGLNETISQLEFAECYARTAGLDQVEPGNALLFRQKLDAIVELVQSIESKLPKPREVSHDRAA